MRYKIDLHTHSNHSSDGGITIEQFQHLLDKKILDFIAITDHNRIDAAIKFQKKLGSSIIVGEEIKSIGGDIIGLYLKKEIPKGLSVMETVQRIKAQDGLVYMPHPFDKRRSGISKKDLLSIIDQVDILEVFNARYLSKGGHQGVVEFNQQHQLPSAAGSDSHSLTEMGTTYTTIFQKPSQRLLPSLIVSSELVTQKVSFKNFFHPFINKVKHAI